MTAMAFPPTRKAALARLNAFLPHAGRHYASGRNYDRGPAERASISMLSPYVRHRLITEQEIVAAVLQHHSAAAADKFIQEVVWRTYWKGWLEQRPLAWDRYLEDATGLPGTISADLQQRLASAVGGRTGVDCFDAWTRELIETGYLHNHARMWFASIWIFTLKLPWQLGADLFLRHLLDGDAASNTLSWRWVAGLHTPGKTYLARPDNIATYTAGRFGGGSNLATTATPLPPDDIGPRQLLATLPAAAPSCPQTLIVTEEDLGIETWEIVWEQVRSVILLDTAVSYPGVSAAAAAFKRGALADTETRLRMRLPAGVEVTTMTPAHAVALVEAWSKPETVVMYEMPKGSASTAFAPLGTTLQRNGHTPHLVRRAWDAAFWPYATAGFFKVKDRIPAVLRGLGHGV